jgi:hypothetical protein
MPCLSLPLQYAGGHEAAGAVMTLRPLEACWTASSAETISRVKSRAMDGLLIHGKLMP